jgi:hypothetical protein
MLYRVAEGSLTLDEGDWQDQSINVLLPTHLPVQGANLVLARDKLPLGMTLDDYIAQQRQNFSQQLAEVQMLGDLRGQLDGREAHFLEFHWQSDGKPIHQMMATVLHGQKEVLNFTGSIPGGVDEDTRRTLMQAVTSFKFA